MCMYAGMWVHIPHLENTKEENAQPHDAVHTTIIEPGYPIKVVFDSRKKMFVPTPVVGCSYTCCCYQVISYCLWSDAFFPPYFDIFFPEVILNFSQTLFIHKHGETFP